MATVAFQIPVLLKASDRCASLKPSIIMGFFQNLFSKKRPAVAPFFRSCNASSYIVGKCIQGDWNDGSFFTNSTSMLLDVVPNQDVHGQTFAKCNKYYYDNINYLYGLSFEQFKEIAPLLNLNETDYERRVELWPKQLSEETYKKMFDILNISFVSEVTLPKAYTDIYVVSVNQAFFLKSNEWTFRYSGLYTAERKFFPQEFIHTDLATAINYAIIISSRLWATTGPDNAYYFKKRIIEELQSSRKYKDDMVMINETIKNLERIEFHAFGFVDYCNDYSSFGLPVEEVLSKVHHSYKESIEKYHKMIEMHRVLFSYIDSAPFYVTQIAN